MTLSVSLQKIAATASEASWAHINDFVPEDSGILNSRGRLIIIFSKTNAAPQTFPDLPDPNPVVFSKNVIEKMHEHYFGNTTATPFNALKGAIDKTARELAVSGHFELGAIAVVENIIYTAVFGGVEALLIRGGSVVKILERKVDETISASGHPKKGDIFILATSSFIRKFSQAEIKNALADGGAAEFAENLAKQSGGIASAIISFGGDKVKAGSRKKVAGVIDSILSVLPEKKLIVKSDTTTLEKEKKRKVAVTVGVMFIVLLGISIVFGISQREKSRFKKQYEAKLTQAVHEFDEAKTLTNLNPARARELVLSASSVAHELKDDGIKDDTLEDLLSKLEGSLGEIAGIYENQPELFLDLSLVSSNFIASDIALSEGSMSVLDAAGAKLIKIGLESKKTNVVAGPDVLTSASQVGAYSGRSFVVNDNGLLEVGGEAELVVKKDWEGEINFYSYAGNLYVMGKNDSTISRYSAITSGFSEKQDWFGAGVNTDLSTAMDWSIDGSIWVLLENGNILKFTLGSPQTFKITGVDKSTQGAVSIYTNEENQFIYILDPANSRVVVINKEGEYKAQYINEKIGQSTKVIASEPDGVIILVMGDRLYSLEIKHL